MIDALVYTQVLRRWEGFDWGYFQVGQKVYLLHPELAAPTRLSLATPSDLEEAHQLVLAFACFLEEVLESIS